jgi:hypothetical protein
MPPTRPVSPAHSHVLATVDQWWGFRHERMHDDIVAMLTTATAQEGSTAIGVGAAGQSIKATAFDLSSAATPQRRGRPIRRLMQWMRHIRR